MTDSTKKKILLVFGTRPEAIKLAPLISILKNQPQCETRVCVTAQHREMLDQALNIFNIQPDYDLNLMKPGQDLTDITSGVLLEMRKVLKKWRPDWLVVQGDTSTTFSASLAGFYEKIRIAHVEAGLRTWNNYLPWPEEMNRRLTSSLSTLHFSPTLWAKQNLISENIPEDRIHVTGNTVIDALLKITEKIKMDTALQDSLIEKFSFLDGQKKIVLVTGHRRENFGEAFENICNALKELSQNHNLQIVYPVHLNPNITEPVNHILGQVDNVYLIEPLDYVSFVYLMNMSTLILTDSGGVQEEAPSLGKPVLVMRDTTERPEGVEAGTVKLVGTQSDVIVRETNALLEETALYEKMAQTHNPYGDGKAAEKIVRELLDK
ncbi:MAG: UDP-N-acetylglucosamine 2-epimerase (non-hydrolyzing) [Nitrospina sp.]|jgi:UDP-N-acetylglucosamine 2-epimerase (non-hydrolysing)|nr:UDP-N-acetylglucosamine 2-epimerase (non-hydrolyzing) [Nitrospina sp.]